MCVNPFHLETLLLRKDITHFTVIFLRFACSYFQWNWCIPKGHSFVKLFRSFLKRRSTLKGKNRSTWQQIILFKTLFRMGICVQLRKQEVKKISPLSKMVENLRCLSSFFYKICKFLEHLEETQLRARRFLHPATSASAVSLPPALVSHWFYVLKLYDYV